MATTALMAASIHTPKTIHDFYGNALATPAGIQANERSHRQLDHGR
jgi:hypothetical protein